jgi:RNA polymerase sigma-70 factor (ECF subfamily)
MPTGSDDYELFLGLFSRNQGRLFAYIRALVPDATQADDVFQATSLVLWRSFATYRRDAEFLPWAIGVARHQLLVHWRTKRRDRHVFSEELLADLATVTEAALAETDLRQRALEACIEQLPQRQRDLIRMFYGEKRPAREIAAAWDRTVHAVYRALKLLRRTLLDCVTTRLAGDGPLPSPTVRGEPG